VPPRDVEALERALLQLVDDPVRRWRMGVHNRQRAETFDWSHIAAATREEYCRAIEAHAGGPRGEQLRVTDAASVSAVVRARERVLGVVDDRRLGGVFQRAGGALAVADLGELSAQPRRRLAGDEAVRREEVGAAAEEPLREELETFVPARQL